MRVFYMILFVAFMALWFCVVFDVHACETETIVIQGKVLVCTKCGEATYCA